MIICVSNSDTNSCHHQPYDTLMVSICGDRVLSDFFLLAAINYRLVTIESLIFFDTAKMSSAEEKLKNPMRQVKVDKLIINCCVGESGDRLTRAAKVLEQLTGSKPVYSKGTLQLAFYNFCSFNC